MPRKKKEATESVAEAPTTLTEEKTQSVPELEFFDDSEAEESTSNSEVYFGDDDGMTAVTEETEEVSESSEEIEEDAPTETTETTEPVVEEVPVELLDEAIRAGLSYRVASKMSADDLKEFTAKNAQSSEAPPEEDKPEDKFEVKLDENEYEPELVQTLKGLTDYVKTLEDKLAGVEQQSQAMQSRSAFQEFDDAIEGLGETHESLFGSGPGSSMKRDTPEFSNRIKVLEHVNVLREGYKSLGSQVPSMKVLVEQAANSIFANEVRGNVRKDIAKTLKKRSSTLTNQDTRSEKQLNPEQSALAHIEKTLRQAGIKNISSYGEA